MIRLVSVFSLLGILLLSAGGTPSWAQSAPEKAFKERQEIMKSLWRGYYRDMASVASGQSTDLAPIPAKAAQASEALKKFATLFPAGSGRDAVPETRTKPEAWTQKAEFEAATMALINETNTMGELAKAGNLAGAKAQWPKVAEACGACHGGPSKSGGKFRFEAP